MMLKNRRPFIPVAPRWLIVLLLACLAANAQQAGTASISGTLVLSSGEPVTNATLWLLPAFGPSQTAGSHQTQTDDLGRFVVQNVQSGDFRFLSNALVDGRRKYTAVGPEGPSVHLAPGEERTGFEITLMPHPSVSGRVFDDKGNPATGIEVRALRDEFDSDTGAETLAFAGSDTTNTAGDYVFKSLPPGRYYVTAGPDSGLSNPQAEPAEEAGTVLVHTYHPSGTRFNTALPVNLELGSDATSVDIRMRAESMVSLRGTAVDENGDPAPGYVVLLTELDNGPLDHDAVPIAISDETGRFAFSHLLPGRYLLTSSATKGKPGPDGVLNGRAEVFLGDEDIDDVQLRLHRADLVFHVRMEDGSPRSASIMLRDPDAGVLHYGRSGPDGTGVISGMTAGRLILKLRSLGRSSYVKSVLYGGQDITASYLDTTSGAVEDLEIVLAGNAGKVSGQVQDKSGNPIGGAWIALWPSELGPPDSLRSVIRTEAGPDGSFRWGSLAPGDYWLAALERDAFASSGEAYAALLKPEFLQALRPRAEHFKVTEGSNGSYTLEPIPAADIERILSNLP